MTQESNIRVIEEAAVNLLQMAIVKKSHESIFKKLYPKKKRTHSSVDAWREVDVIIFDTVPRTLPRIVKEDAYLLPQSSISANTPFKNTKN